MNRIAPPPADLLAGASLFLDFDGTLVEMAPRPDAVVVDEPLRLLMRDLLRALDGRLAIITGRSIAQIGGLFGDLRTAVSGSHGLEFCWADGRRAAPDAPAWLPGAYVQARALAEANEGVVIEEKPFGVALHYRLRPEAEAACHALATAIAEQGGGVLQPGKMMVEVRPAGDDKGSAVRRFMADPAMAGTVPIFIGDDLTDEPAFVAARELGGHGILVGPDRDTAANFALGSVSETLAWLRAALGDHE
ncbi:trehalose-phosphatase [Sphingomonas naphthae]|uniref:Trehalose 6-phosphate phosphatase n=1 Tax=Sphingomonas naphthae TaxID=1813468 RepID=A0ABY7TML2_9SPHN|nr:trehalose-phosphatase [Sphingomonas naphthae]WCT74258.1 trehalose-phosphatase [Sphingomonas naphthae]